MTGAYGWMGRPDNRSIDRNDDVLVCNSSTHLCPYCTRPINLLVNVIQWNRGLSEWWQPGRRESSSDCNFSCTLLLQKSGNLLLSLLQSRTSNEQKSTLLCFVQLLDHFLLLALTLLLVFFLLSLVHHNPLSLRAYLASGYAIVQITALHTAFSQDTPLKSIYLFSKYLFI